jgi:DNA (cytosine-5)-methyltransferase 1
LIQIQTGKDVSSKDADSDLRPPESFRTSAFSVLRSVRRRDGTAYSSSIRLPEPVSSKSAATQHSAADLYDYAYLRSTVRLGCPVTTEAVRVADVFSGCGLMSLGVLEACRALGKSFHAAFGIDTSEDAVRVYRENFGEQCGFRGDVGRVVNGQLGDPLSSAERQLRKRLGKVDIAVGGPPCQGHSNLNNHTRRSDPRNKLYHRMARIAEILRPQHLIVENVSDVVSDRHNVVGRTAKHLRMLGYSVDDAVLELHRYGVPQRRKRHFMVASLLRFVDLASMLKLYERPTRTVRWAIADLVSTEPALAFDRAAVPKEANRIRIEYLFKKNCFDLPDSRRPDCHRLKQHSYRSIYGRMYWDKPAQTITSGFTCMGQGRFVHPECKRTLTPHEAARLQFIPDFFKFPADIGRSSLAELIANAVPVKMVYILALELLR